MFQLPPPFLLFKLHVFQLLAWWAQWLLWLLLTECSNVLTDIYKAFLLVFRLKLHLHPVCQLRNRLCLIWLVWTGLQFFTDLCRSDHCWGKWNVVISITFYTWNASVAGQYLMLWHRTSTGLPAVHQHLWPTRGPWDLGQLELVAENASRWQPCQ